jgi:hypothetical protein
MLGMNMIRTRLILAVRKRRIIMRVWDIRIIMRLAREGYLSTQETIE